MKKALLEYTVRRSWPLLALLVASTPVLAASSAACSDPTNESVHAGRLATSIGSLNANALIADQDLVGGQSIVTSDVQAFLQSQRSALANYSEGGKSAAEIIVEKSEAYTINPVYMLARIQAESSLIGSGNLNNLGAATGCGCPDTASCDPNQAGFTNQVQCAAYLTRSYLTSISQTGQTPTGWAVGQTKSTLDPCAITPANAATAALYTYTPWVGAYTTSNCGADVGGTSLAALEFVTYSPSFPSAASPPGADGKGVGVGACSTSEASKATYNGAAFWTCQADKRSRYICDDTGQKVVETCASSCTFSGIGADDLCSGAHQPMCTPQEATLASLTLSNGETASYWTCSGDRSSRYICDGQNNKIAETCSSSCASEGQGLDDLCQ